MIAERCSWVKGIESTIRVATGSLDSETNDHRPYAHKSISEKTRLMTRTVHRCRTVALTSIFLVTPFVWSSAQAAVRYVNVANTNPVPPFADWTTAATNIQDAVDAASSGDEILVTNGVYRRGGRTFNGILTNRVIVDKPLTVTSVNGPGATTIEGYAINGPPAVRCVYLAGGATLAGFTISNGTTLPTALMQQDRYGGGVLCESTNSVITNCVLTSNTAYLGGGAYQGALYNCLLTNNYAQQGGGAYQAAFTRCALVRNTSGGLASGGGAYASVLSGCLLVSNAGSAVLQCTLDDCVVVGNSVTVGIGASRGGGAISSTLNNCTVAANGVYNLGGTPGGTGGGTSGCTNNNCIIYYNTAASLPNDDGTSSMSYCDTAPLFGSGRGNISTAPLLVNPTRLDVHLQTNSPCINAGRNTYVADLTDFDGNPRIAGGTVDIGAYEYPNPTSTISYAWLQQYGLPTDGSADQADTDRDGMNNWQEWICGTNPTNASSLLQLLPLSAEPSQVTVTWQSVTNRTYFLQRSADLSVQFSFQTIATTIPGQLGTTTFIDTTAMPPGPFFYRVGVAQ